MKRSGHFWIAYSDLMTSLFFIMLVLYVVSFVLYRIQIDRYTTTKKRLENTISELEDTKKQLLIEAEKAKILEEVEENLKPLKENRQLFRYEKEYKRFTMAFDVKFYLGRTAIRAGSLENYDNTIKKIDKAGNELKHVIDKLLENKKHDARMNNVSYLVIIAGYASNLINENQHDEYERSYNRAYNLWEYWKRKGVNFEDSKYNGLIDLQIAGNGWGGVGRYKRDPENHFQNETNNQRFIIQIVPKIGDES